MSIYEEIILHDFSRPLRERMESRKHVGPYTWKPTPPMSGRGFYMESSTHGYKCARYGSAIDLRIEHANDVIPCTRKPISYGCDEYGYSQIIPIIARLPNKKGFLIGWTMGQGMCAALEPELYHEVVDAGYAAHSHAEHVADKEREYQESQIEE